MIALYALLAHADPAALRAMGEGPEVVLDAGTPSASAAVWTDTFGVAVGMRSYSAVELAIGWRWELSRGVKGWGIDATIAPVVSVPTLDPTLALGQMGSLQLGVRGARGSAVLALVEDLRVGLDDRGSGLVPQLQWALLLEPRFEVRAGPVHLGLRGAMGVRVAAPSTLELEAALTLRVPWGS